LRYRGLLA